MDEVVRARLIECGWKSEDERARAYAAVDRRQRQIDSEARQAAPVPKPQPAPHAASNSATDHWVAWVRREIKHALQRHDRKTLLPAVAEVVFAEEQAREAADAALRDELAEMRERLERLEAAGKTAPLKLAAG
jgi:hypothetical protein